MVKPTTARPVLMSKANALQGGNIIWRLVLGDKEQTSLSRS